MRDGWKGHTFGTWSIRSRIMKMTLRGTIACGSTTYLLCVFREEDWGVTNLAVVEVRHVNGSGLDPYLTRIRPD